VTSRISLLPRHEVDALKHDERAAVEFLEHHLWLRHHREALTGRDDAPLEVLDDGTVGVFLTIGYVQTLLRDMGADKIGEDHAATVINTILPRLGLLQATGYVKKPRVRRAHPGEQREEGGRHAQPSTSRAYWWRIFRLPTLTRLLTPRVGAYPLRPGNPTTPARDLASLVGLLRCQGLVRQPKRPSKFGRGSVQAAFWATGPP
jgi:hypothetical protein